MESNTNNDEIDIFYLFKKFNELLLKGVVLFFRAFNFILRNWIIVLVLLILGLVFAFFTSKEDNTPKKSQMLLRVNFDMADYVFNSVDLLNDKIEEKDSLFLKEKGLWDENSIVMEAEIKPIVNFYDIIEKYTNEKTPSDRSLDILVRNLEFEDDLTVAKTFNSQYKYYDIDLKLSPKASYESLENFEKYLNSNKLLISLRDRIIESLKNRLVNNDTMIKQMDRVIESYNTYNPLKSNPNQLYVEKDLNIHQVFVSKLELTKENEELKKEILLSKDVAVVINQPYLAKKKVGLFGHPMVMFPLGFVFIFLLISFFIHSFKSLRNKAEVEMNKTGK